MYLNIGYVGDVLDFVCKFVCDFRDFEVVVMFSGFCVVMVCELYLEVVKWVGDEELLWDVEVLVFCVYEFFEFLVNKFGVIDVGVYYLYCVIYYFICYVMCLLWVGDVLLKLL